MLNKTKEVIASAKSRMNNVVVIVCACAMLIVTTISGIGAIDQLDYFTPIVSIKFKDGVGSKKDYQVRQDKVTNVLKELDVSLNAKDKMNMSKNEIVENEDYLQITRVTTKKVKKTQSINFKTIYKGAKKWGSTVVQKGKKGKLEKTYLVTYENNKQVSKKQISSKVVKKAVNKIIRRDKIAKGTTFTGRLTTYGGDCRGCSGLSASGVKLSAKTGVNGSKSPYLKYKGKKYYCIAADRSIPFGTIIEISNHNLKLPKKILAIVVDRGGAIKGRKIDIFNGSERRRQYFKSNSTNSAKFKIVKMGSGKANFWKK